MRGKALLWICLAASLLGSMMFVIPARAQIPEMYVDPPMVQTNPGNTFSIAVKVKDVPMIPGVAAWEFKLRWDVDLTEFPPTVTEGSFLSSVGPTTMVVDYQFAFKYVMVGCMLNVPGVAYGAGTLATVTFTVKPTQSGVSAMHLFEEHLLDQDVVDIEHITTDGFFYTTKPYVTFNWSPAEVLPGAVATFNATGTVDPDNDVSDPTPGPIADYAWDFGDGSPIVHTATVTTTHTYAAYDPDPYMVTLTVTDDDGEVWFLTKPLLIWRNVAIVDIWPSIDWFDSITNEVYRGQPNYYDDPLQYLEVLVTVVNLGSTTQVVEIYCYADLDTSVLGDELQLHWWGAPSLDHATLKLKPGTGTGWNGDFMWWLTYSSGQDSAPGIRDVGDYTISAKVFTFEDQDLSNNEATYGTLLHVDPECALKGITKDTSKFHIKSQGDTFNFAARVQNVEKLTSVYAELYAKVVFELVDGTGKKTKYESNIAGPLGNDVIAEVYAAWTGITEANIGTYKGSAVCWFGTSPDNLHCKATKRISFTIAIVL